MLSILIEILSHINAKKEKRTMDFKFRILLVFSKQRRGSERVKEKNIIIMMGHTGGIINTSGNLV